MVSNLNNNPYPFIDIEALIDYLKTLKQIRSGELRNKINKEILNILNNFSKKISILTVN